MLKILEKENITLMKKFMTFQGDVDIRNIDSIPKSASLLNTKTVMYGEKTGHHHTFQGQVLVYKAKQGDCITVDGRQIQIEKYVDVKESSIITHQEHATQTIPKGKYIISQETEWDPLENQLKKVID